MEKIFNLSQAYKCKNVHTELAKSFAMDNKPWLLFEDMITCVKFADLDEFSDPCKTPMGRASNYKNMCFF